MKRLAKFTLALVLLVVLLQGNLGMPRHVMTQNIDDNARSSIAAREKYFSATFPTRNDIRRYLSDATILLSSSSGLNTVYYFRYDGRYYIWNGNDNIIVGGDWFLYPIIVRRIYNGRSRSDLAYEFCRLLDDGSFTDDNCVVIASIEQIMAYSQWHREYAKGDIFNLSKLREPPFHLPPTLVSMEQLREAVNKLPH